MKKIVVFGAGKSATCLVDFLVKTCEESGWHLTVADGNAALAAAKTGDSPSAMAIGMNVEDASQRQPLIEAADIVISLLPPTLHILIAKDCVQYGKNLLTASYTDDAIRALQPEIEKKGLLFLCEMGLDPGIDHMSAMQLIHKIQNEGGAIRSFYSHCGGLVAPESDNNPWHYKISWNPRNVVMAGKLGASYRENGEEKTLRYEEIFSPERKVSLPGLKDLSWYPNRDSLTYIPLYDLEDIPTFIRTTVRYPEFCFGWKNIIELKLTDEEPQYDTNGMTLQQFFQQHFNTHGFSNWIEKQLTMHEANLSMKQLLFLGMDDDKTLINKGFCSAADVLQFALERKLALEKDDKDMIVMLHEIEYEIESQKSKVESSLIVKGEDNLRTAMAKTVGLPLGIAAKLILQGKINIRGLHIPILPEIYEPVMEELAREGIVFNETES